MHVLTWTQGVGVVVQVGRAGELRCAECPYSMLAKQVETVAQLFVKTCVHGCTCAHAEATRGHLEPWPGERCLSDALL